MDSDEFDDDDIADEDLLVAVTQAATPPRMGSITISNPGRSQIQSGSRPSVSSLSRPAVEADHNNGRPTTFRPTPRVGEPTASFRQTTLFGQTVPEGWVPEPSQPSRSQPSRNRVFRADLSPESPTHHELDQEALKTWVYPTNLGVTRDYQFSIVQSGLFHNTLVALPTGLGKTFIAATIMLNYFRWMKTAKLVFVAPTKPLVSQQIDACFHIAGIPRSQTTLLTGETAPDLRDEEWQSKRVFFMTPQTLHRDLVAGRADPKSIGLLVIDEAHRATGKYSYVPVVSFLRKFSSSFRILALTATPGSKVEAVQEVIDGLGISHVEIRTENSLDIRPYVHQRNEEIVVLDPSEEIIHLKELFSKALKPLVDKLGAQNSYYSRDPMALTVYGLVKAKKEWLAAAGPRAKELKGMMSSIFALLTSLAHTIKLLSFHGIKPFYDSLVHFRDEVEGKKRAPGKYKKQVLEDKSFQEMMNKMERWLRSKDFVGHPKLTHLCDTVLNHFMDAGDDHDGSTSNTRIIVFSEYRDSAEEIVRVLNTHQPLVRAAVFVGQADSKRSEGMKQAEQIERIKRFKEGEFNVLVATSIGEEGLDIGQVDLIICYDASASPIRMLQRMGRTGRKRAGRVVLLLMRGKEEDNYAKSKDGYEKMQSMICDGSRFNFRHDLSTRIVPRGVRPQVDMRVVEIPVENTQVSGLPEPKKSKTARTAPKKRPPKKFHMPDGVETGFQSVASMVAKAGSMKQSKQQRIPTEEDEVADIPALSQVLLNSDQTAELNEKYLILPLQCHGSTEFIEQVDVTRHPVAQRVPQKTVFVKHGAYTERAVRLFQTLAKYQSSADRNVRPYGDVDTSQYHLLPLPTPGEASDPESVISEGEPAPKRRKIAPTRGRVESHGTLDDSDDDDELEELSAVIARVQSNAAASKKNHNRYSSHLPDSDEDMKDVEDELPPPPKRSAASNAQATRKQAKRTAPKAPRAKTKRAGGSRRMTTVYDESADEGDDCRRTSDLELTEDSDSGADLEGFIVADNMVTSSLARRSTSPVGTSPVASAMTVPSSSQYTVTRRATVTTSASAPGAKHKRQQQLKAEKISKPRYYEPTVFAATQDSTDDDVPSLSQAIRDTAISGAKGARGLSPRSPGSKNNAAGDYGEDEEEEEEEDDQPIRKRRRGVQTRKRNVVLEDEETDE
ncbi:type III restriction enzyme [Xylariaceae sp. FL0594]|nr:type III restriction enzyme [Xylariaceae sp. FL0594]